MEPSYRKVLVATTILSEPIPGVLANTELGDVIIILESATNTYGVHAPGDMLMNHVFEIMEDIVRHYTELKENPFDPDEDADLITEFDFIYQQLRS